MNASEFVQQAGSYGVTVILSMASGGAVSGLIALFAREWITSRVKGSIEHEYAQKLETYKAKLTAEHDIALERLRADAARQMATRDSAMDNFAAARNAAYERRLNAIDVLWKGVLMLRERRPQIVFLLDNILVPQEYPEVFTNPRFRPLLDALSTDDLMLKINKASEEIEQHRPFMGELLYSYFWAYRALVGRTAFLVEKGRDGGKLQEWFDDPGYRTLVSAVLTKGEIDAVNARGIGKLETTQQLLEGKILTSANKLISGEESAASGLEQARNIEDAIRTAERRDQKRASF